MPDKIAKPSGTATKVAKPTSGKTARFGIGTFGSARFGTTDGYDKTAKPSNTPTKIAKPE